jgi:putative transposase
MTRRYRKSDPARKKSSQAPRRKDRKNGNAKGFEVQLPLSFDDLTEMMQDSLHTFAVEMGLMFAQKLLEEEVTQLCGGRHQRQPERRRTRYGRQAGVVTVAGQKAPIHKPRVRRVDGSGEVSLETYALLQRDEAMPEAALKRMVRGVSCRDYEGVIDMACDGFGVKKSSISRGFVKASAEAVAQFASRRFDEVRFVALFIDGVDYAGETMICALGIDEDGHKQILGLRQGATENKRVVTALLEDLAERGLDTTRATLFVLDGAKSLHAGVKALWGRRAIIQRCQIHKKRNVKAHLSQKHWPALLQQLKAAYEETDYDRAKKALTTTARWLDRISPDAAASLREGLEETITVIRLGIPDLLRKTLSSTNPIESAFDTAQKVTARVKRWRDGDMRQRWCTSGLLRAEEGFNRLKGYRQISRLITALNSEQLDTHRRAS